MAEKKKSNTKYLELKAVFNWAKVFPQNMDKTGPDGVYESHDGAYTVDLLLDEKEFKKLSDAGSQKEGKPTEDGLYKVKVIRKHTAPYTYGGAPQVAHVDGTPWDIDEDGLIGNGSSGIAYVSVYQVKGRFGTRLDGIQILNKVEYESDDDGSHSGFRIPDLTKGESGQKEAAKTPQAPVKPTKEPAKKPALMDDEIPF
jgi:hypothetical protein